MKEKLYTIPLNEAMDANDECPLCVVKRNVEQDLLDYCLGPGASYMESDTRDDTDKEGFCREHFKKMFDYGNALGNAWILKTHYKRTIEEMERAVSRFSAPAGKKLFSRSEAGSDSVSRWIDEREQSCYICRRMEDTYERYLDTFFVLYKKDDAFRDKVKNSKGFCLPHFKDVVKKAADSLDDKEKGSFYDMVFDVMKKNMERISNDVAWFVEKFDYRNADEPWKDSKDAIQRGMQKLAGGFPADPVYKNK